MGARRPCCHDGGRRLFPRARPAARGGWPAALGSDGTGRPLGINDPILFWVLLGVFGLVWGLYSTSVKEINPAADDEDGLSL